ncbi:MAG TPA: PhzF family phenazine biosynthesis protein [Chthoniobacterales bacterium]
MIIPYYHVDAFTVGNQPFSGNPAGVCFLTSWLPDDLLQSMAAEHNLAETAFAIQKSNGEFDLRWFTPEFEMDLCGHATLAPAHVIFEHFGFSGERIGFDTRSGRLTVNRKDDVLELDFPSRPPVTSEVPPELIAGLGMTPVTVMKSRDYLAVFESEGQVAALKPDFSILAKVETLGIIATAPGQNADFVSRFFAPRAGVPEDPVTGSAHSTLIPYWAQRLGKTELHAFQLSKRRGELLCQLRGDRVGIAGRAVTYSTGFLRVEW